MSLRLSILVDSKADTQGFKQAESGMKNLNNNLKNLQAGFGAIAGAAVTFKQAFEMSREGASVLQLRTSFERMNQEVYKTPGLLDAMKEATRGTVGEGTLMASMLTLTAGASQQVSQAMAAAAPQLAEIAKAASTLNPTLGDTSMMFDSLGLGIKRQSPMILDNLGLTIRIGEANQAMADKLGKSVEALTAEEKQMALLNEVLRAGGTLIEQTGGTVDAQTDAWDRLTVKINEGTTSLKTWLAEGLQPVIAAMADDYGNEVESIIDSNIEQAQSIEDLQAEYIKMDEALNSYLGLGALVTGTQGELKDGQAAIIEQLALSTGSAEEFVQVLQDMGVSMDGYGTATSMSYRETWRMITAEERAAEGRAQLAAATEQLHEQMSMVAGVQAEQTAITYDQAAAEAALMIDLIHATNVYEDLGAATEEVIEPQTRLNDLWSQSGTAMQPLFDAYDQVAAATGEMIRVDGQWVSDHEIAKQSLVLANAEIATSYKTMAADAILAEQGINTETLNLLVTMGLLTQEQADQRMEFVNNSDIINSTLIPAYESGRLSAEELNTAIDLLANGTANSGAAAIAMAESVNNNTTPALRDAKLEAGLLGDELEILGGMTVTPGFNAPDLSGAISQAERLKQLLSDLGNQGSGGGYGGNQNEDGGVSGGGNIPEYATGTSFHPGGLALLGEKGPELVSLPRGTSVATASETRGMLGGGQTIIQVGPIYALSPAMSSPRVLGAEIARNIGSKMIGG